MTLHTSLGNVRAHTKQVANEILGKWDLYFAWGIGASGEHKQGRALDFMIFADGTVSKPGPMRPEIGRQIADYLWANRVRLGVWYVIYDRKIISTTYPAAGWQAYKGSNPHRDHVHVSFQDNPPAYKPQTVSPYIAFPGAAHFKAGAASDTVGRMNMRLRAHKFAAPASKVFDTASKAAYAAWQRSLGYAGADADGVPGESSWDRLQVAKTGALPPTTPTPPPAPPKPPVDPGLQRYESLLDTVQLWGGRVNTNVDDVDRRTQEALKHVDDKVAALALQLAAVTALLQSGKE